MCATRRQRVARLIAAFSTVVALSLAPFARADDVVPSARAFEFSLRTAGLYGPAFATGARRRALHDLGIDELGTSGTRPESLDSALASPPLRAVPAFPSTAVGLDAGDTYDLGQGFGLGLDLADDESLPIKHLPQLANVIGRLAYHPFPASPARATLFLGCGASWIDFEDSQTLANRIQARPGALLTGGFSLSF